MSKFKLICLAIALFESGMIVGAIFVYCLTAKILKELEENYKEK